MTTITRQQLRDAIEKGIAAAAQVGDFRQRYARALRAVGDGATVVSRGRYVRRVGSGIVGCPVAQAFPDWRDIAGEWNKVFATRFDGATFLATGPDVDNVLHVTDNEGSTEGGGMSAGLRSNDEAVDILDFEGTGYATQHYCSADDFADARTRELWGAAKVAQDALETYLENATGREL